MSYLDEDEIDALEETFDADDYDKDSHDAGADKADEQNDVRSVTEWDYAQLKVNAQREIDRLQQALKAIYEIADGVKVDGDRMEIFGAIGTIKGRAEYHGVWMKVEL